MEASLLARLTLDLLVLADELRLYLTGQHPSPTNISDMFCPVSFSNPVSPEPAAHVRQQGSSVSSSADFLSAETTPILDRKTNQGDTDTTLQSLKIDYNKQLMGRYSSSSSEDITLHDDANFRVNGEKAENSDLQEGGAPSEGNRAPSASDRMSMSTDITSLPDLQSMSSLPPSRLSNAPKSTKQSDCSEVNSPVTSPLPPVESKKRNEKKEDHIYEEIGDIRAQVAKLRSCASVPNLPPPLPPKTRSPYFDEESSADYSRSDWSTTSSMGGSTGRRRKKRRAPLPPSFLYAEQIKENVEGNDSSGNATKEEKTSTDTGNPFYEEIGENLPQLHRQESAKKNPFYEPKPKPAGYVGSNPFYEDIDTVRKQIKINESALSEAAGDSKNLRSESFSDDATQNSSFDGLFDESDGKTPPVAASRPKRKAPRPPSKTLTEEEDFSISESAAVSFPGDSNVLDLSISLDEQSKELKQIEEPESKMHRIPSESELQEVDLHSNSEVSVAEDNNKNSTPKNVNQKQLQSSQDVVSVSGNLSEGHDAEEVNPLKPAIETPTKVSHSLAMENEDDKTSADKEKSSETVEDEKVVSVPGKEDETSSSNREQKFPEHIEAFGEREETISITKPRGESILSKDSMQKQETENEKCDNTFISTDVEVDKRSIVETDQGKEMSVSRDKMDKEIAPHNLLFVPQSTNLKNPNSVSDQVDDRTRRSLHISDEIPYIDTSDSSHYKYATVQCKRKNINKPAASFLHNSIPFIDDSSNAETFPLDPPPLPPSSPPPPTPPATPPPSPQNSPPSSPPPLDQTFESAADLSLSRFERVSEEADDEPTVDSYKEPMIFNSLERNSNKSKSTVYYEIPELPDSPPPLPAKPNNLKTTPELPPKSQNLLSQFGSKAEEEKYEIPELPKANQQQVSPWCRKRTMQK